VIINEDPQSRHRSYACGIPLEIVELVYSEFGLDRFIQDFGLFRVRFRQVLYRILVHSGFGLNRFYTGF